MENKVYEVYDGLTITEYGLQRKTKTISKEDYLKKLTNRIYVK